MSTLNIARGVLGLLWLGSLAYCYRYRYHYKPNASRRNERKGLVPIRPKHDAIPSRLSSGCYFIMEDDGLHGYVEHYETNPDEIIRALQEAVNSHA